MIWLDPPKGFSVKRHMDNVRAAAVRYSIYEGKTMSEAIFEDILAEIASKRRYKDTVALRNRLPVVLPLNGTVIDRKAIGRLGMFLLEHDAELRSGKIQPEWNGTPRLWVVARVEDIQRDLETPKGVSPRFRLKVVVLAGPPAGYLLQENISPRYATFLPKILGVPTRTEKRVMPLDAVGMVFFGNYGAVKGRPMSLLELNVSSAMKTMNKRLFERRHP